MAAHCYGPARCRAQLPVSSVAALQSSGSGYSATHRGSAPEFWGRAWKQISCSRRHSSGIRRKRTVMMPIGVPKVPYRTARERRWQWVDIWNCLYRERIIFIGKPVDDELGNELVATMLFLDSENQRDVALYINCAGGEVVPTLAIHDCMNHMDSKCSTVGFGGCLGMSGFLLAVGEKGKRYCLSNTRLMLHHPSGAARGQAADIHSEARELLHIRDYVNAVLSNATGQPYEKVFADLSRNKYFTAKEALEYGIIDQIIKPARSKRLNSS